MKPYYQEDNLTIYNADSLELLPELKADLCITDTPYGIDLKYDVYTDTDENWVSMFSRLIPLLKTQCTMSILPCCQIRKLPWIYQNFPSDWLIIWHKGSPGHRSFVGFNDYEPLLVYGKNKGVVMHDFFYCQPEIGYKSIHPCPKPVKWSKWLIHNALGDGKVVIDPFLGSGATLMACKELGVAGIGIELSEKYCELSANRLRNTQRSML